MRNRAFDPLELGEREWCEVARLDSTGNLLAGPVPPTPPPDRLLGAPLPPRVREAMTKAIPPTAPVTLRSPLKAVLAAAPIHWGDPGPAASAIDGSGIVIHAGLLTALPSLPPDRVLAHLASAISEPARVLAARTLQQHGAHG